MKKILGVIMAMLFLVGLSGCFSSTNSNSSTSTRYEFVGEIDMDVDYSSYLGYSVEIKGKMKNTTKKEFSYVSVTFAIYDAEGNQIETAMDNMNYLQPGGVWSFTATMFGWTEVQPTSCKLVEVDAW